MIDHTLLRPDANERDILRLCNEAGEYGFYAVCVNPSWVKTARSFLSNTGTKIAAVIGFPLGMTLPQVKIYEAMESLFCGADELDMVINIGNARSGNWTAVTREISDVVAATGSAVRKIIIETCFLSDDQKARACEAVLRAGAEFIKTSTGMGTSGATVRDVAMIKSLVAGKVRIKAAGGIKTMAQLRALVNAGAERIGTSSGVAIIKESGK